MIPIDQSFTAGYVSQTILAPWVLEIDTPMDFKLNDVSFSPGYTLTNGLDKFEDEGDSIIIEVTTVAFNFEISCKHDILIHIPIAQILFSSCVYVPNGSKKLDIEVVSNTGFNS